MVTNSVLNARPACVQGTVLAELRDVGKIYGTIQALDGVCLSLRAGEITAIVGKNGGGKSTIIKILSGAVQPDSGAVLIKGVPKTLSSPSDALHNGIATVHQELSVIASLTVAENISLGNWPRKLFGSAIDLDAMAGIARSILAEMGEAQIEVNAKLDTIPVSQRQIVEIARAFVRRPAVLLLDEPFSTLSAPEVAILKAKVTAIASSGLAVAFVSHRLREVKDIADTIAVMRDGRLVANRPAAEMTIEQIVHSMLGDSASLAQRSKTQNHASRDAAHPRLAVRGFSVPGKISGIDLDIWPGEIVGIAGLLGSGRSEFLRGLAGVGPCAFASYQIDGKPVSNPRLKTMIAKGVYFVPEERKLEGFTPQFSVMENLHLPGFARKSWWRHIAWPRALRASSELSGQLGIKLASPKALILSLSGGNQQKVVIGKWLQMGGTRLLLLDEPSRGVDVHARQQIQAVITDLARSGVAVLMVSSEFEELFEICDRIVTLKHGAVVSTQDIDTASLETITSLVQGD